MSTDSVRRNIAFLPEIYTWSNLIIKIYLRRLSNTQVGYLYSVSWFRVFWLMLDIFPARLRWVGHTPNSPKSMLIINKWVNEIEFIIFYIYLRLFIILITIILNDYLQLSHWIWLPRLSSSNIVSCLILSNFGL